MKSVRIAWALLTALSLGACLEAQKVSPPPPVTAQEPASNSVMLNLPRTALAELGRSADRLVIRAFKVDNGVLGTEVREAYQFTVTEAGLYSLEGLPLGEVEFQVALFDEKNQVLAEGNLRATINPGAQTLQKLVLKPLKPTRVDLDMSLALQLVNFPEAPVNPLAEPEALRTVITTYKCQSCHNNGARPMAGLNLQTYPYKNAAGESLAQIMTKIEKSITGSDGMTRMPPNNTVVKDEDVAVVRNFLQAVNDATSAGQEKWVQAVRLSLALDGEARLDTSLALKDGVYTLTDRVNLIAGSRYAYTLTVFGPGGSKLYEALDGTIEVPLDGRVQLKLDVVYQAPNVTLPVVVGE